MSDALVQTAIIQNKAQAGGGFGSVPSSGGGNYIDFSTPPAQGATVNLTPVSGGFGGFDGDVILYAKGDEAVTGTPIEGASPTIGQNLGTFIVGLGSDPTGIHLTFDDSSPRIGRTSSLRRNPYDNATRRDGGFGYGNRLDTSLYISYFKNVNADPFGASVNYKEFYVFADGVRADGGTQCPQPIFIAGSGNAALLMGNNIAPAGNRQNDKGWTIPSKVTQWGRREILLKLNTPNLADGVVKLWINRELGISDEAYEMQPSDMQVDASGFTSMLLGYFDKDITGTLIDHSDFYVATSPARVELGNASTWAACTHTELQPVVATDFTNNQILNVTIDKGGISGQAWMYVIKSDGTPYNLNGELI